MRPGRPIIRRCRRVVGLAAEIERHYKEVAPVLLLADLAGAVVVEIDDAAGQFLLAREELPRLGVAIVGDDAASPYRRRQVVCRLCRRHGAGDRRSAHRPGPSGADFRRGHGRLQFYLRRGELDPGAGRLDRRPYPSFAALGGVPKLLVPDNTRVAVIKAGRRHQSLSHTVRVGETKKRSLGSGRRLMTATVFLLYQKGWDSPDALRLQHLPTPIPDSPLTTRAAMMDVCSGW